MTKNQGMLAFMTNISYKQRRQLKRIALNTATGVALFFILFVIFWMASSALRPAGEMFTRPVPLFPKNWTLDQFHQVINDSKFILYYGNSIFVAFGVVVLTTVLSTLGGYGLARIDIPYKRAFARSVLLGYMFPPILLAIPMFIFWRQLGLTDTYIGLILAETAISLPFCLWLMWKFFQTVPYSLEEQALMSGASRFRAFYEIALPMAKPGMVAVAVYTYAVSWNEFTIPKVIMHSPEKWPLTVGVHSFTIQHDVLWGQVMAASTLTILPIFLFVYFLQKYLMQAFRTVG